MQVAGGLAALYPAGSVPISDAAAPALETGEPGTGVDDGAAVAGELRDASVEFGTDEGGEATPRQPAKTDTDSIGEEKRHALGKRPGSAKVSDDMASIQRTTSHAVLMRSFVLIAFCNPPPDRSKECICVQTKCARLEIQISLVRQP